MTIALWKGGQFWSQHADAEKGYSLAAEASAASWRRRVM